MDAAFSRYQRLSHQDQPSFSPRANPHVAPRRDQSWFAVPRQRDPSYPNRCNPNRPRSPLNEAQKGLANRYLPLARAMARRVARTLPQAYEDLQSGAYMALVEAAQSFDPSRKVDFAVYARHRIEGALRDVRREAMQNTSSPRYGRASDSNQVGLDLYNNSRILGAVPAPAMESELEDHETVQEWIRKLPRLQSLAFRHIYLEGKSQEEAAVLIGCSAPTLSRLHKEAIATIQYACARD
jgi:RNA polymerase sigma factor (sigma-70 family)